MENFRFKYQLSGGFWAQVPDDLLELWDQSPSRWNPSIYEKYGPIQFSTLESLGKSLLGIIIKNILNRVSTLDLRLQEIDPLSTAHLELREMVEKFLDRLIDLDLVIIGIFSYYHIYLLKPTPSESIAALKWLEEWISRVWSVDDKIEDLINVISPLNNLKKHHRVILWLPRTETYWRWLMVATRMKYKYKVFHLGTMAIFVLYPHNGRTEAIFSAIGPSSDPDQLGHRLLSRIEKRWNLFENPVSNNWERMISPYRIRDIRDYTQCDHSPTDQNLIIENDPRVDLFRNLMLERGNDFCAKYILVNGLNGSSVPLYRGVVYEKIEEKWVPIYMSPKRDVNLYGIRENLIEYINESINSWDDPGLKEKRSLYGGLQPSYSYKRRKI